MMTYPGNTSLSADIRERILSTFRQTLDLASRGSRQEASLGCDFILRLDPDFDPARVLMSRLEGGQGPVAVDDLRSSSGSSVAPESRQREVEDLFGEFGDSGPDDGVLGRPVGIGSGAADPELRAEFSRLHEERRFTDLLRRAEEEQTAIIKDPELARLADSAQARQEAGPYVSSFLESARQALRSGDTEKATGLLEKARQLDPSFPGLADLQQLLLGARAAASSSPPPPPPSTPPPSPELADEPFEPFLDESQDPFPLPNAGDGLPGAAADSSWQPTASEGIELGETAETSGLAAEGDERVRDLLQEGQAAFERSDYQGAIDAWSRIFLIDIDHQEAARRIEEARRLKAEHERQVEEIFHEAVEALDRGDSEAAEKGFQRVVQLQPNHLAAREYLHQLEAGETPQAASPARSADSPARPLRRASVSETPLQQEILVPPEPGITPVRSVERPGAGVRRSGPRKSFLAVGGAVLVLLLAAAWFVWQRWDHIFPNTADQPTQTVQRRLDPIAQATARHEQGETDVALRLLRRLPADDPHFDAAQALISQWEAEGRPPSPPPRQRGAAGQEGSPDVVEEIDLREQRIAAAHAAAEAGDYLRAEKLLNDAAADASLEGDEAALLEEIQERLQPLRRYVEMIEGGNLEPALPDLWRLLEANPEDRDVRKLLVTAYYNLGVRDLQRGDTTGAAEQFQEAYQLDRSDSELERHLLFARSYSDRTKDLLYQIYVKYIPFR